MIVLLMSVVSLITFIFGVSTDNDMYKRDYALCVKELPRNKDCKPSKIIFEIVNNKR